MEFSRWERYYNEILQDMGYEREKDELAANVLSELLSDKELCELDTLKELITNKSVSIFGNAPSLPDVLDGVKTGGTFISTDGATTFLLEKKIQPHIIVTDLDGKVEDQIKANEQGAIAIIHAHGDNIDALKKWVPMFKGKVMGTTQSKPFGKIYNFGGFTDGDRAIFLADHFSAEKIILFGFDFRKTNELKNEKMKVRKLTWASVLIGILDNSRIFFHFQ
ncbi:MAG: 6-hydroxymethylpterin diphosphokinase MptE-like protein [Candidatus Thermoplasmatota archaeon]